MTPLAQDLAEDLLKPKHMQKWVDLSGIDNGLNELHFFELSEIHQLCLDMRESVARRGIGEDLAFMAADKIWLEADWGDVRRAVILIREGDYAHVWVAQSAWKGGPPGITPYLGRIVLKDDGLPWETARISSVARENPSAEGGFRQIILWIYAALAMINTPRVIGRRQRMVDRGAQRRIARRMGSAGKFPLRAWTELKLEVRPPRIEDGEPSETRLSGDRARHFVRCHLRIVGGRLVLVTAHWRGNEALGTKNTRYRLTLPKDRAA